MIFIAIHCNAMGGGGTTTASESKYIIGTAAPTTACNKSELLHEL